jgi:putative flippase GtrA
MIREIAWLNFIFNIGKENIAQAIKYLLVGGICTILDFTSLYLLTRYAGFHYLLSSIISFMSGTFLNYFLCTSWIFKIRIINDQYQEFFYYAAITGIGLVINTISIWLFTEFLGIYFMLSKIFAAFVTYWWNFGARKYFLHTLR